MRSYTRAVRRFFETSTLHGFKYLFAQYYSDRIVWLICCCASAGCAAVLCTVVWARFLQVPALITLKEVAADLDELEMPMVAICPPPITVAAMFTNHFKVNETTAESFPDIFEKILRRKYVPEEQLVLVDEVLEPYAMTFTEALFEIMPPCKYILTKCQWQSRSIPCNRLFEKDLTQWGVCCVSSRARFKSTPSSELDITRRLTLAVQCYDKPMLINCHVCIYYYSSPRVCQRFFTKYDVEEWFEPALLYSGHLYRAQLSFASVVDNDPHKLLDGTCAARQFYSRSRCLLKCLEERCGCLDVIRLSDDPDEPTKKLQTCPLPKLNCLRTDKREKTTCNCLPTCKKVSTRMIVESSPMNAFNNAIDNIYSGLNVSKGSVLTISLGMTGTVVSMVSPTETWITLLSSLGGVFNMFLGVGFFSLLELLFFILIRLPVAFQRSTEINQYN
ncbi:sodium channel protein Nach-like [Pieris rapae]|uniref:sodium channel protein Nach-like n=1 Tax=Pieris rapae TaxID=64459 RepID=UPI001E27E886|nr:sodium channel protein Nach-like [Pieris rapae]